jgi:hypothetical protein
LLAGPGRRETDDARWPEPVNFRSRRTNGNCRWSVLSITSLRLPELVGWILVTTFALAYGTARGIPTAGLLRLNLIIAVVGLVVDPLYGYLGPFRRPVRKVRPLLRRLLDELTATPAMVLDPMLDIVAWNQLAATLLVDFGEVPEKKRNYVRLLFTDPVMRSRYPDWTNAARGSIAQLRAEATVSLSVSRCGVRRSSSHARSAAIQG